MGRFFAELAGKLISYRGHGEELVDKIETAQDFELERLEDVAVKGKEKPLQIYEVKRV